MYADLRLFIFSKKGEEFNKNENVCKYKITSFKQMFYLRNVYTMTEIKSLIEQGKAILGIELGSTVLKLSLSILNPMPRSPLAATQEKNHLENGIWTYHLDEVWEGIQDCYADMVKKRQRKVWR